MDDDNPVLEHNPALGAAAANPEQPGILLVIKQMGGESLPLRMPARAKVCALQQEIAKVRGFPWYQAVLYAPEQETPLAGNGQLDEQGVRGLRVEG